MTDEESEKQKSSHKIIARKQLTGEKILDEDIYEPVEIVLTTLHIIEFVVRRPEKGPHGEPKGFPNSEQRIYHKIMDKIESLSPEATHIELQNSEVEFIVKKTKAYKERWWAQDKIFDEFEVSFGIIDEEEEEKINPSLNGQHRDLEAVK